MEQVVACAVVAAGGAAVAGGVVAAAGALAGGDRWKVVMSGPSRSYDKRGWRVGKVSGAQSPGACPRQWLPEQGQAHAM